MSGDGKVELVLTADEAAFLRTLLEDYKAPDAEREGTADWLHGRLS